MFALYSDGICGTVPPKGIVPRQCGGAKAARTREGRWCSGWYGLHALFLGSDRFRVLRPVKVGDRLSLDFAVARVEERDSGFAVHYDFSWHADGEEQPVTLGNFIVRYWPQ